MNRTLNIFVSGVSGIVGYGVVKTLLNSKHALNITGTSIYDNHIGTELCHKFIKVPKTNTSNYLDWFQNHFSQYSYDLVIPGIEDDMKAWNKIRSQNKEIKFLLNNESLINLCSDKWHFFKKLKEYNISCKIDSCVDGSYHSIKEKFGKRFVAKPRDGYGSKDFRILNSQIEFESVQKELGERALYQKYIPDDEGEYTCSVFFDYDSQQCSKIAFKRELSKDGYTNYAETVDFSVFQNSVDSLAKHLKPIGPTNFQFRVFDGNPYLLEINPRISSSTSIKSTFGYNEAEMSIDYFVFKKKLNQPKTLKGKSFRYTEDYTVYE